LSQHEPDIAVLAIKTDFRHLRITQGSAEIPAEDTGYSTVREPAAHVNGAGFDAVVAREIHGLPQVAATLQILRCSSQHRARAQRRFGARMSAATLGASFVNLANHIRPSGRDHSEQ